MKCKVENGMLIIETEENTYSFEAHAEAPRPSMLGWGLSAGGRHWSNRDENIKLEKHTSVQDVAVGDKYAAWYTQELLPDGVDYKLSKNAKIYLGDLQSGETRELYKGECYGDLVFDNDDLYFNVGNKVAVIHIENGSTEVLFKHSGIKKNRIGLQITPKRIFFIHWTKDKNNIMWYDRASGEVINPHADIYYYGIIDEDTIVYDSVEYSWKIDLNTLKKKHFFTGKQIKQLLLQVCGFFDIPHEYYAKNFTVSFRELIGDKLYFVCQGRGDIEGTSYSEYRQKMNELGLPHSIMAEISCGADGKNAQFVLNKEDIKKKSRQDNADDEPYVKWSASTREH